MASREVARVIGIAGTGFSAAVVAGLSAERKQLGAELNEELRSIYKGIYGREPSEEELARFTIEVRDQEFVGQIDSYEREDGTLETYERDDFEVPTELFTKLEANELGLLIAVLATMGFAVGTALTFLGGRRS